MSSEWRRGWGGAEEGQALRELAPLKCGCLGLDNCEAGRGLLGLAWAGLGDLDARPL